MTFTLLKKAFSAAAGTIILLFIGGNAVAAGISGITGITGIDSAVLSYKHGAVIPEYSSNRDNIAYYDVWGWWASERIDFVSVEWRRITSFQNAGSINALQSKINKAKTITDTGLLRMFGVDTTQLQIHQRSILEMYNGFYRNTFKWNRLQLEHLADTLNSRSFRIRSLRNYLTNHYPSSTSANNYILQFYKDGKIIKELGTPTDLYACFLDNLYPQGTGPEPSRYRKGKLLLEIFLNDYIENNWRKLYDLGWYDHKDIVEELSKEFDVAGKGQFWDHSKAGGKYTLNDVPQYIFSLKHNTFPSGVTVNFIAGERDGKLFLHSGIAGICNDIVQKAVSYPAISRLREDMDAKIQLYIFNDRPINDYLIEWAEPFWRKRGIAREEMDASIFVEIKKGRECIAAMCLLPGSRIFMYSIRDNKGLQGFEFPDDIWRTGPYNIYGELFTPEGKIIRAAGLDSISVTWKGGGDTHIYNLQKGTYRGFSDSLEECYESGSPYVIRDSAVIGQIYNILLNYRLGAFYEKETDRKIMKELGLEYSSIYEKSMDIWKMCANNSENDSLYFKRFKMNKRQKELYRWSFAYYGNLRRYLKYLLKGSVNYGVNHYGMVFHWANGKKDTLLSGRDFYPHYLTPYVKDVWKEAAGYDLPRGDALLKKLHELYMLEYGEQLHQLGKYDILPQLEELGSSFEVGEAGLLMDYGAGGGVYVQNDVPAYYAVLRTKEMHPQLSLKYIFEERDGKFPSFGNLVRDCGDIVERVQQNSFFNGLLKQDSTTLSIAYINDAPVSVYMLKDFWSNHPGIFRKNPSESSENRKAIFVECTQPEVWGTEPCYKTMCYLLMPNGDVLACGHGNRFFFKTDYKVDKPETWRNNRDAVNFIFHPDSLRANPIIN